MKVIDLTQAISPEMPVYPGTETPDFVDANTYDRDGFKETKISFIHIQVHMLIHQFISFLIELLWMSFLFLNLLEKH